MVITICEVIDVVSSQRVNTVVYGSLVGSLACPGEVCLQSWGPCVQLRKNISVVSPPLSEHLLKSIWKLLKWRNLSV